MCCCDYIAGNTYEYSQEDIRIALMVFGSGELRMFWSQKYRGRRMYSGELENILQRHQLATWYKRAPGTIGPSSDLEGDLLKSQCPPQWEQTGTASDAKQLNVAWMEEPCLSLISSTGFLLTHLFGPSVSDCETRSTDKLEFEEVGRHRETAGAVSVGGVRHHS